VEHGCEAILGYSVMVNRMLLVVDECQWVVVKSSGQRDRPLWLVISASVDTQRYNQVLLILVAAWGMKGSA